MKTYKIQRQNAVHYRINYAQELDTQQLEVVTSGDGPMLVIAGAGSGKTRTITYRVARLIEQGVSPDRILLVTFTNKAAREMLSRVDGLIKTDVKRIWGGTFHSIGNRILRRCADTLGYTATFSILDSEDAKDLLEAAVESVPVPTDGKRFPQAGLLQEMFSLAVNKSIDLGYLIDTEFSAMSSHRQAIVEIFNSYQQKKKAANCMDYDDLLLNWKLALVNNKDVAEHWSDHFQHVLVDEYQDTNKLQAEIVDLLAAKHRNVMVVGDDAQSIYAWRGANFENIYKFQDRYADAVILRLERNYRSRPEIIALANASIENNVKQHPKKLQAVRVSTGEKPALVPVTDAGMQSQFVCSRIIELHEQGLPLSDMAVLYRSHWQCLEIQLELTRRGVPYAVRSGTRFFEQAHIKDMVAYLRIIANPKDEAAWKRVLKLIPGIGKSTVVKIWQRLAASNDPLQMIAQNEFSVKLRAGNAWTAFSNLIGQLKSDNVRDKPGAQIDLVLSSGYQDYLYEEFANANARAEDLQQLAKYATRFDATQTFLSELSLVASERFSVPEGTSGEDVIEGEADDDKLALTSIHQAKGLEWKAVFIVWASDGKFPAARSLREVDSIEEERRLFYVSVTRAKDELYVCYPQVENDFTRLSVVQRPSRFVSEVDQGLFETWAVE